MTGAVVGECVGSTRGLGYHDAAHGRRVSLVEISRRVEQYLLRWRPSMAQTG